MTNIKHLGTTVTNKNYIHNEIKEQMQEMLPFSSEPFVFPFPL
jgi:hypothetical protein